MRGVLAALLLLAPPAAARTWQVGPDSEFKAPSAVARLVADGDTVLIAPGEYYDCAAWSANRLTIAATGPGAVLTDTTCQGKAIFITDGNDVTIQGLTFARARVGDGNGAGIRAQGGNLTIRDSRFVNNQTAILTAANPAATLTITGSRFESNGACDERRCVPGLGAGGIGVLRVERSVFTGGRGGTLVQSGALRTEIRASRLEDGEDGRAAVLLEVQAPGSVFIEGNDFQKGAHATGPAAIALRRGGRAPAIRIAANSLANESGRPAVLVLDWTAGDPVLAGNRVGGDDAELSTSGVLRSRASAAAHGAVEMARAAAGQVKRLVRPLLPF